MVTADTDEARHGRLDAAFEADIAPRLSELEAVRHSKLKWAAAALFAAAAITWAAFSIDFLDDVAVLVLVMDAAALGFAVIMAQGYGEAARRLIAPAVCAAIGGISHSVGAKHLPLERWRKIGLLTGWSKAEIDDVFTGAWRDTRFSMAETDLSLVSTSGSGSKKSTTSTTIFKGLVFVIDAPVKVAPVILIRGIRWWIGTPWRPRESALPQLTRVTLPHEGFEKRLRLWSNHPQTALSVVGPGLAASLAHLAATAGWRGIDAAFEQGKFILLLPRRGNRFAVGSIFRPAAALRTDAHRLMEEVLTVHRLIDTLIDGVPA